MEQSSQMTQKRRFNIGLIGVGQGGTSLAMTMAKVLGIDSSVISSINLSDSDLKAAALVPEQNRIPLDRDSFGAGKKRDASQGYCTSQKDYVLNKLTEIYTGKGVTIVSFWTKAGKQTSLRSRNPYSEYWWEKLRKLYGRYGPRKPSRSYQ